jgi:hypothetical protein
MLQYWWREWRAIVPDFPAVRQAGATADEASQNSKRNVIAQCALVDEADLPRPRIVTEIQSDRRGASVRGIDRDKAVLSLVGANRIGEGEDRSSIRWTFCMQGFSSVVARLLEPSAPSAQF